MNKDESRQKKYSSSLKQAIADQTEELRNYETVLNTLFENAADGILIADTNGKIVNANQRACEMFGRDKETLKDTDMRHLGKEQDFVLWEERIERMLNRESLMFESEYFREDGKKIFLEVTAKMIRIGGMDLIQAFYRDISEKKKMLGELLHSQKMQSIGVLAGGVAHDFGNILTVILSYIDVIALNTNLPDDIRSHLKVMENSAKQGTRVVSQILTYAKRENREFIPFSVNKVISETMEMMSRLIPKQIAIVQDLDYTTPPVDGDEAQIEQILMNLVINARDAMPDGGELKISTRPAWLKNGGLNIPTEISPGQYINITVQDTGCGIAEDRLQFIFQPFSTTKEHGTGLGLAIAYGLVKDHRGYIIAESMRGKGTTFNIYLPVSRKQPGPENRERTSTGTILVVDDEVMVLTYMKDILTEEGFQVITYDSPVSALKFYRANSRKIDLAMVDIVMPVMDGVSLIRNLREINPEVRTIAITGFTRESIDTEIDGFLKKPLKSAELFSVIRKTLGGA